jgi:hypothetical protein
MLRISTKLNEIKAPLPNSIRQNTTGWRNSTIHYIIRNETYVGVWHYGKRNGGTTRGQKNPRDHWIAVKVPPIILPEIFDAAKGRIEMNKTNAKRNRTYQYLLGKQVTCGECGCKAFGKRTSLGYQYYYCPTKERRYARDCSLPHFRVNQVDTAVWSWLESLLLDDRTLEGL